MDKAIGKSFLLLAILFLIITVYGINQSSEVFIPPYSDLISVSGNTEYHSINISGRIKTRILSFQINSFNNYIQYSDLMPGYPNLYEKIIQKKRINLLIYPITETTEQNRQSDYQVWEVKDNSGTLISYQSVKDHYQKKLKRQFYSLLSISIFSLFLTVTSLLITSEFIKLE